MQMQRALMGNAYRYVKQQQQRMAVVPVTAQGPYNVNVGGSLTSFPGDPTANYTDYMVNVPGKMERITQPLYSYVSYPAAGAASLRFFQTPIGQSSATLLDTNMEAAGQLPAPQMFLIQGIGIDYLPGTTTSPPVIGPIAEAKTGWANDMYTVLKNGALSFVVGSKNYLNMSPLMTMPPRSHYEISAALSSSTTAAAALMMMADVGWSAGPVFQPIPMLLEANQNFNVTLNFPTGAIAIPSGDALARIGVWLYGTLIRPAQ